ncbi:alpha/beta hydrolase [Rhodoblastus acidophilus]|uniref:Alpha/beta hydrolase n=1 Tax=Rhodoblastus acidophilus TaxID=1074 RepID=A0A6N8DIV4_RHOAC|nr:alpha/beta fold hydrolase [Rhodoblastus acidophilus]MCW2273650.1 putative alpha/beta-hydrolase family hydrolase [Rhodoblastus acidophilus]MTV30267.1 alpha/beta hydrolase [Rhodoblastus acidophilus]
MDGTLLLLAPGSGAPSSHPRMQAFRNMLEPHATVVAFDYAYALDGRKSPDRLPKLIETHRAALTRLRQQRAKVVLVGKSMGGRVGCHVALVEQVDALVCLGYPLCGAGDAAKLRDDVLLALTTPILFVQGARDRLCPLDLLEGVRKRMSAPNALHVVEGGDHALIVGKTELKARGLTQEEVDAGTSAAVGAFLGSALGS